MPPGPAGGTSGSVVSDAGHSHKEKNSCEFVAHRPASLSSAPWFLSLLVGLWGDLPHALHINKKPSFPKKRNRKVRLFLEEQLVATSRWRYGGMLCIAAWCQSVCCSKTLHSFFWSSEISKLPVWKQNPVARWPSHREQAGQGCAQISTGKAAPGARPLLLSGLSWDRNWREERIKDTHTKPFAVHLFAWKVWN